jgi:membrane-associated phospholipid phosphatase
MQYPNIKSQLLGLCLVASAVPALAQSSSVTKAGDILAVGVPLWAYGMTFSKDDEEGRSEFYKSFATTVLITQGLKNGVNEKRPNGGSNSFPSGHTSGAVQGAAFIHARYGFEAALPAYAASAFVGYSRVDGKYHYTHDVIAGAAIGYAASMYFTKQQFTEKNAVIVPFIEPKQIGVLYARAL